MKLRSLALKSFKKILASAGYEVRRRPGKFGEDVFADIERLRSAWNYSIDIIFDVGANDGATALRALSHFPGARVFCFEPHPITFAKLERQTKNRNIQAVNLALGNVAGEHEFFEFDSPDLNSMLPDAPFAVAFGKEHNRTRVQGSTLDIFCTEHLVENVDILKVDTEGFDLAVLEGSENLLKKRKIKFIYTEFYDLFPMSKASGGALIPIAEFLRDYGFRFVASYNDHVWTDNEMFLVANALFVLPPDKQQQESLRTASAAPEVPIRRRLNQIA
jgi:FkbM family methyltransferase